MKKALSAALCAALFVAAATVSNAESVSVLGPVTVSNSAFGVTLPFSSLSDGQTATTSSALSLVAWNGTTMDRVEDLHGVNAAYTLKGFAVGLCDAGAALCQNVNAFGGADSMATGYGAAVIAPYNMAFNGTLWDRQRVDRSSLGATGALLVAPGGRFKNVLTPSSTLACTSIETVAASQGGRLTEVINAAGVAQTVTVAFYDEGASPTCAAADLIYSATALPAGGTAGSVITLGIPLTNGLARSITAAPTANIVVLSN